MLKESYYVSRKNADFMELLLDKLGINATRDDGTGVTSFTIEGYSMRTHILVEDIFDRVHDHNPN